MTTFSEMKFALDEIASETARNRRLIVDAKTTLSGAQSALGAMPSKYTGLSSAIDDAFTANPGDIAYEVLKSEKDKLSADFQALKAYCDALIAAYNAVVE